MVKTKKKVKNTVINILKKLLELLGVRTVEREGVFVIIEHPRDPNLILFVQHRDDQKWSLPGGGIKQAEFAIDAAKREVLEETGFEVEINPNPIAHLSFEIKYGFYLLFKGKITNWEEYMSESVMFAGNGNDILRCQFIHKDSLPQRIYNAQKGNIGWLESYEGITQYGHPNKPPIAKYRTEKQ